MSTYDDRDAREISEGDGPESVTLSDRSWARLRHAMRFNGPHVIRLSVNVGDDGHVTELPL